MADVKQLKLHGQLLIYCRLSIFPISAGILVNSFLYRSRRFNFFRFPITAGITVRLLPPRYNCINSVKLPNSVGILSRLFPSRLNSSSAVQLPIAAGRFDRLLPWRKSLVNESRLPISAGSSVILLFSRLIYFNMLIFPENAIFMLSWWNVCNYSQRR